MTEPKYPDGVALLTLKPHEDARGSLVELFRNSQGLPLFPQMNYVQSQPGVLRGVHVHPQHADYLFALSGTLIIGLHDIRRSSPTFGHACVVTLDGDTPQTCFIPNGVAHGFYTPRSTAFVYGLSSEWGPEDDIGCRWDDPELGLDWPLEAAPILSERDTDAPPLKDMVHAYEAAVAGLSNA